jgi:hypothetical protein
LATDYSGDEEQARHAARVATVRDVKGERPERGRHIEQGELSALIDACVSDTSPAGIRDAAIIALAWWGAVERQAHVGEVTTEPNPFYDAQTIIMPVATKHASGGENERLRKLDEVFHVGTW